MSELQSVYIDRTGDWVRSGNDTGRFYLKSEADKVIAERDKEIARLKDKCQMHDFFWEGCGFAKRGFKNTIAVSEAFDKLEAENESLLQQNRELCQALQVMYSKEAYDKQKYKRCLAMADYAMYHHFRMLYIYGKSLDDDKAVFKINYGLRWRSRWLALAGQFTDKEAK